MYLVGIVRHLPESPASRTDFDCVKPQVSLSGFFSSACYLLCNYSLLNAMTFDCDMCANIHGFKLNRMRV